MVEARYFEKSEHGNDDNDHPNYGFERLRDRNDSEDSGNSPNDYSNNNQRNENTD